MVFLVHENVDQFNILCAFDAFLLAIGGIVPFSFLVGSARTQNERIYY